MPGTGIEPARPFRARDFKLSRLRAHSTTSLRSVAQGRLTSPQAKSRAQSRDLYRMVPGTGIEPVRPFRDSGF